MAWVIDLAEFFGGFQDFIWVDLRGLVLGLRLV